MTFVDVFRMRLKTSLVLLLMGTLLLGCDYIEVIYDAIRAKDPMDLTNGIDFKKADLPPFVESFSGISFPEKGGRWTDTRPGEPAVITFKTDLPENVTLIFHVHGAYGPNREKKSKIIVGDQEKTFKPTDYDIVYTMPFKGLKGVRTIKILPAEPTKPSVFSPPSGDNRNIAIMLDRLGISKRIADE